MPMPRSHHREVSRVSVLAERLNDAVRILRPPPKLTVSEWADRYRVLTGEASPEPGPWRTSRAPYLRGIMDAIGETGVSKVVWMAASQLGKTEAILNVVGYFIDQDPSPILVLQPNEKPMGMAFSKDRLAPMLRESPALKGKVKDARVKGSGNTLLHKVFPGGHVTIAGANSPSGLASRPIRVILPDEVDRYPASAGAEGDPLSLARQRSSNFWNRKEFSTSTPTVSGLSRIEREFDLSDQRRYFVPCPECGEFQVMVWAHLQWEREGEGDTRRHLPESAAYACEHCGTRISEDHKFRMLSEGEWRPTNDHGAFPGFHLNALYSPWVRWKDLVQEWVEKYEDPVLLQTFVNLRLGEPFEAAGAVVDDEPLMARREEYGTDPVPDEVCLITAGVDVQADRLEVEVVGWGPGERSWSLDYFRIPGDPSVGAIWSDLDLVIGRTYPHPTGAELPIAATAVDSGYETQQVYKYAKARFGMRVWAIKGIAGPGRPIMDRPSTRNNLKVPLYPVGVDTAKGNLYARLMIEDQAAPGYCHFPRREPYDREFFRQLTSERVVTRVGRTGIPKREWVRRHNRRAEVLDCRVYAMAALAGLQAAGVSLEQMHADLGEPYEEELPEDTGPGWVNSW